MKHARLVFVATFIVSTALCSVAMADPPLPPRPFQVPEMAVASQYTLALTVDYIDLDRAVATATNRVTCDVDAENGNVPIGVGFYLLPPRALPSASMESSKVTFPPASFILNVPTHRGLPPISGAINYTCGLLIGPTGTQNSLSRSSVLSVSGQFSPYQGTSPTKPIIVPTHFRLTSVNLVTDKHPINGSVVLPIPPTK